MGQDENKRDEWREKFDMLQKGMSEKDVIKLLGTPSSKVNALESLLEMTGGKMGGASSATSAYARQTAWGYKDSRGHLVIQLMFDGDRLEKFRFNND